jgi:hypothetical protein
MTIQIPKRAAAAVLFLSAAGVLPASNITLTFDTLPSAQAPPWTYQAFNNSLPEGSAFSVSGGQLLQNTMGSGFQLAGGGNLYRINSVVDPLLGFVLTVTAQVTQEEVSPSSPDNHEGFFFGVSDGLETWGIALGTSAIVGPSGIFSLDATTSHTYTMQHDAGASFASFFLDGVPFGTVPHGDASASVNPFPDGLLLGDTTGGVNAAAAVTQYVFTQAPSVPEPGTEVLLGSALVALGLVRRRFSGR